MAADQQKSLSVCVFCSANDRIAPEFFDAARTVGAYLGKHRYTLVYGGCSLGLMECVAQAAHESGSRVIGVVPSKVEENGHTSRYIDELIRCGNLTDRKQIMMDRSDVFVALPGGLGTLDEIFTVAASQTLDYHTKKVILFNVGGFWEPCIRMLDEMQTNHMMRKPWSNQIAVVDSIERLEQMIFVVCED